MMKLMEITFPLGREIMTTIRLMTGGLCSLYGLGLDDSEDCKVCVTESLLLLMHGGCREARVRFSDEDGLRIVLEGEGGTEGEKTMEEEISVALLRALVEDLNMEKDGRITRIGFGFRAR